MRKREKTAIMAARIVSLVFTPFYLPLVGLMALFAFSYLSLKANNAISPTSGR